MHSNRTIEIDIEKGRERESELERREYTMNCCTELGKLTRY